MVALHHASPGPLVNSAAPRQQGRACRRRVSEAAPMSALHHASLGLLVRSLGPEFSSPRRDPVCG